MFENYEFLCILDEYIIYYKQEFLIPLSPIKDGYDRYFNGNENKTYWDLIKRYNDLYKKLDYK